MNTTKRDRYLGAMVGILGGDALGASYENQKAAVIEADMVRRGGLVPFNYIDPWEKIRQMYAGQPTDDSELAAALAESLITHPEFDPEDLYSRLRSFIHGRKSILTNGEAYGSGGTLRKALAPSTYAESLEKFKRNEVPVVPSNGSLMRCIAVPLCYCGNIDNLIEKAQRQSGVTHVHPFALAACTAYSLLVSMVLDGLQPSRAWELTKKFLPLVETPVSGFDEILKTNVSKPQEDEIWPNSGSVILSFRIALWASLTAVDFRDGITKAVSVGGDTDTYAAIAGGILGAHFGVRGIPPEWRKVLIGRERMESLAIRLYEIAYE